MDRQTDILITILCSPPEVEVNMNAKNSTVLVTSRKWRETETMLPLWMHPSGNFVNVYTKLVNVYTNMADNNKMQMVLSHDNIMVSNGRSRQ